MKKTYSVNSVELNKRVTEDGGTAWDIAPVRYVTNHLSEKAEILENYGIEIRDISTENEGRCILVLSGSEKNLLNFKTALMRFVGGLYLVREEATEV